MSTKSVAQREFIVIGIKVIDLLCPIPKSGVLNIYYAGGLGKDSLIQELALRQKKYNKGFSSWCSSSAEDKQAEIDETKVSDAISWCQGEKDAPDNNLKLVIDALDASKKRCGVGGSAFLFYDFHSTSSPLENERVRKEIGSGEEVLACWIQCNYVPALAGENDEKVDIDSTASSIVFSKNKTDLKIYPAVDTQLSDSLMMKKEIVGVDHFDTAMAVKKLFQDYKSLEDIVVVLGQDELSKEDRLTYARARKLEKFLSQPFFAGEVYTGVSGNYVDLEDTIAGVKSILNGDCDDLPEAAFYMSGNLQDVKAKAAK